jgi:hypothetical protein
MIIDEHNGNVWISRNYIKNKERQIIFLIELMPIVFLGLTVMKNTLNSFHKRNKLLLLHKLRISFSLR